MHKSILVCFYAPHCIGYSQAMGQGFTGNFQQGNCDMPNERPDSCQPAMHVRISYIDR